VDGGVGVELLHLLLLLLLLRFENATNRQTDSNEAIAAHASTQLSMQAQQHCERHSHAQLAAA